MQFQYHAELTLGALKRWFLAQCYESLLVGALWWMALKWLAVPGATFWAVLAAFLQVIPHFGPLVALMGPAISMRFGNATVREFLALLGAFVVIELADGLILQPVLQRRMSRVPFWASLLTPIVLGILIPFWGILLAPPLLAILFAYLNAGRGAERPHPVEQRSEPAGEGIILPPEKPRRDL